MREYFDIYEKLAEKMPYNWDPDFLHVWRLENEAGQGPFTAVGSSSLYSLVNVTRSGEQRFTPWPDARWTDSLHQDVNGLLEGLRVAVPDGEFTEMLAGVQETSEMSHWLDGIGPEGRSTLRGLGFRITVYRVIADTVFFESGPEGIGQCAFYGPLSEKITEFEI